MNDIERGTWSDDVHADAALYAVDALEPAERAAFEEHLSNCEACRREVDSFGRLGGHLAGAVAQEPPPELRENVLAAVRATRSGVPVEDPARPSAGVVSLADRRRPRRQWWAAAAAAVLLPAAALGGWGLGAQNEQQEQQLVALEQDRQNRLLSASDITAHRLEVSGRPATLLVSAQEDEAMFVASDLPGPGEGREYQLWLMQDGTPVPDVHFGGGQVRVWLDGEVERAGAVAMTVEPSGGSATPTLPALAGTEI